MQRDIRVIPNFVDTHRYRRVSSPDLRRQICPSGRYEKLIVHTSNLGRSSVRSGRGHLQAHPGCRAVSPRARRRRSRSSESLPSRARFGSESGCLHPRRTGSAGSAALGRRLVSSSVTAGKLRARSTRGDGLRSSCRCLQSGRLPEVIDDGVDGYLRDPDDLQGMAEQALKVLEDSNCTSVLPPRRDARSNRSSAPIALCLKDEAFYREVLV